MTGNNSLEVNCINRGLHNGKIGTGFHRRRTLPLKTLGLRRVSWQEEELATMIAGT
jgi:hypothetical protein